MAEALTIARPYAEAAFKLAAESGSLADWSDALARLTAVAEAEAAGELLENPLIDRDKAAAIIAEAAGKLKPEQRNFVKVLAGPHTVADRTPAARDHAPVGSICAPLS